MVGAEIPEVVDAHPPPIDQEQEGFTPWFRPAISTQRRAGFAAQKAMPDKIARLLRADSAKALVMRYIGQLVADGFAEWEMLDNGDTRLRFNTGETFLLTETVIIRLG
jgi:hypothetical protein